MLQDQKRLSQQKIESSPLILDTQYLDTLRLAKWVLVPWDASHIVLNFPEFTPTESAMWASRLNRDYRECGCQAGAVATISSLSMMAIVIIVRWVGWDIFHWIDLLYGVLVVIIASGAGKFLAVAYAHRRMRRTLFELDAIRNMPRIRQ